MTRRADPTIGLLGGRWIAQTEMRLPISDLGFRQGATAVERLRTYRGDIFHPQAHLDRWQRTVDTIGIEGLPLRAAIEVLMDELIARNQSFADAVGDFGITLFATPGSIGGDAPTFGMHLNAIDHEAVGAKRTRGQILEITDVCQPPPNSWPRSIKVRSRLHYYLADEIAAARQSGAIGVLIDSDGSLTDTSVANLAIVESGTIVTPPPERVLGGITQQVVERLARDAHLPWDHVSITPERLVAADEVLLMGTDGGLWFARRVGRRTVGDGRPGKVYRELLTRFDDLTGYRD